MTIINPTSHALLQSQCASQKEQLEAQQQELAKIREHDQERTRLFDSLGMELKKIRAMAGQECENETSKREAELRDLLSIEQCRNAGLQKRLEHMTKETQHRDQQSREQVAACHTQREQIKELRKELHSVNEEARTRYASTVLNSQANPVFQYKLQSQDREIAVLKQNICEMHQEACSHNNRSLKMRNVIQTLEDEIEDLQNRVGSLSDWLEIPRDK